MRRLYCRIFGHKWRVLRVDRANNVIWKLCNRCATGGGFKIVDDRQFAEWKMRRKELFGDDNE